MSKFAHTCILISFLGMSIAFTNSADAQANLLSDPSFELPDASGGDVGGCAGNAWNCFNNNFISSNLFGPPVFFANPRAHSGTQVLKQFLIDAGYFQDAAANPGDTVDASVYAMNWNGDNFNNIFLLQIFALNAEGNSLDANGTPFVNPFEPFNQVVAAAPDVGGNPDYVLFGRNGGNDFDWTQMQVSSVMPANTVSTRIQLIHILVESTPENGAIFLDDASLTVTVPIAIDIKPGSDPVNPVNPESKGVIPVAVLGSMDFDATQVDFSTVEFGPGKASPVHDGHVENVNGDGFDDMVFHFNTQDTGITCGDTEATLLGETFGGDAFTGTDSVNTAGCK